MRMLSLGIPSTLGNWLNLCNATFGEDSKPSEMFRKKILESSNGENEEVIADEGQLLMVCGKMFNEQMEESE